MWSKTHENIFDRIDNHFKKSLIKDKSKTFQPRLKGLDGAQVGKNE